MSFRATKTIAKRRSQLRSPGNCSAPPASVEASQSMIATNHKTHGLLCSHLLLNFQGFDLGWCEVPCTRSYLQIVASRPGGFSPGSPRWSATDGSLLGASPMLQPLEAVSWGPRNHSRRCSLRWGALGRDYRLMFGRRPSVLLCWSFGIPPRAILPTLESETVCLANGSPRTL